MHAPSSSPPPSPVKVEFCALSFDSVDRAEVIDRIASSSSTDPFAYVVTPNVDHMVRLHQVAPGDDFRRAYHLADLRICDSRTLAMLGRLAGKRLQPLPGSDLTNALLNSSGIAQKSVAFLAADEAAAQALAEQFKIGRLAVHIPPMNLADDPQAIADCVHFLKESAADIILIGVGSPQQELVALAASDSGEIGGIALCIGSAVDFATGRRKRAPRLMQKLALEWLYRLLSDPRKMWVRYLVRGPLVFPIVLRALLSRNQTSLFP